MKRKTKRETKNDLATPSTREDAARRALVVAAHPDDEILGCGGTMARLAAEGWEVAALILGEGVTSRDRRRDAKSRAREIARLEREMAAANGEVGATNVFKFGLPDNRFDSVDLLDIVKILESVVGQFRPSRVYTHHRHDVNVDHRATHEATLAALRPLPGLPVRELYAYEVLSSTEWRTPSGFAPDHFVDIAAHLPAKLSAMAEYPGELRAYPHPRSLEGIGILARFRGLACGLAAAEAFETLRRVE